MILDSRLTHSGVWPALRISDADWRLMRCLGCYGLVCYVGYGLLLSVMFSDVFSAMVCFCLFCSAAVCSCPVRPVMFRSVMLWPWIICSGMVCYFWSGLTTEHVPTNKIMSAAA